MGYRTSLISVNNINNDINELELLKVIGFENVTYLNEITFEEADVYEENVVCIGYYNNCVIILDGYRLTDKVLMKEKLNTMAFYEKSLSDQFPQSEILSIACNSANNFHMYSLVKDKKKVRVKMIATSYPMLEFGDCLEEEVMLYENSKISEGCRLFRLNADSDYKFTEDQFMENFVFGVAKRHLGVIISSGDDEQFYFDTPFKKYLIKTQEDGGENRRFKKSKKTKKNEVEIIYSLKKRIEDLVASSNVEDGFLILRDVKNTYKALLMMGYLDVFKNNTFTSEMAYNGSFSTESILENIAKCCAALESENSEITTEHIKFTSIIWCNEEELMEDEVRNYLQIVRSKDKAYGKKKKWWDIFR